MGLFDWIRGRRRASQRDDAFLQELSSLLEAPQGQGPAEGCSRCHRRYRPQQVSDSGMFVLAARGGPQTVALRCVRCRKVYCQWCAKYEAKGQAPNVVLGEYELRCDCGSTNFRMFPAHYV
jgi:hypothetical protein